MTIFGKILTGEDVCAAIISTIKLWSPDYLAEVAEQHGKKRGDLPTFRYYGTMLEFDKYEEMQNPACIVIAPGTLATPISEGKALRYNWGAGVGLAVSGKDKDSTYKIACLYTAAVRALLVQHPSLGGFAEGISLLSERYDPIPADAVENLGAGIIQLGVDVKNVVDTSQGPTEPSADPTQPPGDWPAVESVTVDIEREVGVT